VIEAWLCADLSLKATVVSGPGPPGEQARLHNADLDLAQLGEGAAYRIVDDAVVPVLSEMVSSRVDRAARCQLGWSFSARPPPEPDVPVSEASGSPMTTA
jgi:hypothetical protein